MTTKINQKEYLKKYLSSNVANDGNNIKKKKKKKKNPSVKIIDDDDHSATLHDNDEHSANVLSELFEVNEDAPQIVNVFDERPFELITNGSTNNKWKAIGTAGDKDHDNNGDMSPPRRSNHQIASSSSSNGQSRTKRKDSDNSPPRRRSNKDQSPSRQSRRRKDSDNSPPRRRSNKDQSPLRQSRKRKDSDNSPPRRSNKDQSPSRHSRRRKDSDNSPPRRSNNDQSPSRHSRTRKDSDNSPPRRSYKDQSPSRHNRTRKDSDNSPPRRQSNKSDRNQSNEDRTRKRRYSDSNNNSKTNHTKKESLDDSPPPTHGGNRYGSSFTSSTSTTTTTTTTKKLQKTLDGKTAGLQNARAFHEEQLELRKREESAFNRMPDEMSGRTADVIVRDRRTGRVRDLKREAERNREKMEREHEKKQVYDRWGAGLKQIADHQERVQAAIHEMNKPLARFADDKDLDALLKQQERAGDPMLEYLRKKEQQNNNKTPSKPMYQGSYPENRYSIRPGYRWDGVDRSNGYEKKWFDVQSTKKAGEEEAYRYSTEDM